MKPNEIDRLLLDVFAKHDALTTYASRSHGGGIEFQRIMAGHGVAWHPASGAGRRESERVIDEAVGAGFLTVRGGRTSARRIAMTPTGVWRASAWCGYSLAKTAVMLCKVWDIGESEPGSDTVSPLKLVPSFRLDARCGEWWAGKEPAKSEAAKDVYSRLLPAVLCGWCKLAFQGSRGQAWHWWKVTDEGVTACERFAEDDQDMVKLDRMVETIRNKTTMQIADTAIERRHAELAAARELKGDPSDVGIIPLPDSRWWTPKGGVK